jgi:phospholipid/cholesterol/gamma-HCH transport system substrate-binding protein
MNAQKEKQAVSPEALLASRPARRWTAEAGVGVFVIVAVLVGLVGLFSLTDAADFRGRSLVHAVVPDAGGLRRGDPVQMRGVVVGRVNGFSMVPEGVELVLEVEDGYPVPADSRVVLRSNGVLGGRVVDVVPGTASETVRSGTRLPAASTDGLFEAGGDLAGDARGVLARTRALLSEDNVDAVGSSAAGLAHLVQELNALANEQRAGLAELSTSLRRSATGLEEAAAGPELPRIVQRLDTLTASLDRSTRTLAEASRSAAVVLARLEAGEGTLGRLSRDDSLYVGLNRATDELARLLQDVRENPKRYVELSVF